jgi:hypothetical protein
MDDAVAVALELVASGGRCFGVYAATRPAAVGGVRGQPCDTLRGM